MEYLLTALPWQEPIESKLNRKENMSNQLTVSTHSFAEVMEFAKIVSESKALGLVTPAQVAMIMFLCQSEGIHPMQAVRDYHIVQNRPCLKTDVVLARFLHAGGKVKWLQHTDKIAEASFIAPNGDSITPKYTWDDVIRSGLQTKETYVKYPARMMMLRLISFAIKTIWPGVLGGLYTVEEAEGLPLDTNFIDGAVVENITLREELLAKKQTADEFKKLDEEFYAKATELYGKILKGEMTVEIGLNEWNNLIAGMLAKGLPAIPEEIMQAFKKLLADEINKPYQPILGDAT